MAISFGLSLRFSFDYSHIQCDHSSELTKSRSQAELHDTPRQMIAKYTRKEIEAFATASSIAHEVLQSIRTVTAFHGQAKEEER